MGGAWAQNQNITVSSSPLTSVDQINTSKYYVLYNQGRKQYLNVSAATGQVLMTGTLPTTDTELLPFIVRFVSNTNAKSEGDAYQLKFYDGTYLPWQSNGSANYVSATMGYNNNEAYLPAYKDGYFYFQVYKGGTSRDLYFNGNVGSFTFWSGYSENGEYQIYEVTCDDFQEIEYNFALGEISTTNVTRRLLTVKSSTAPLPTVTASSQPQFTTATAPTASSDGSSITFTLSENYPFLTTSLVGGSIPESAPLYRLKGNVGNSPKYIERTSENNVAYKSDNTVDADDYFCFTGNAIDGFRIYNVGAGTSVNLGSDTPTQGTPPALTSNDHVWRLYKNGSDFGLQQLTTVTTTGTENHSNAYLCNVGSTFTYWKSSNAETTNDGGARMQCERVTFDLTEETYVKVNEGLYELISSNTYTYNSGAPYTQNIITQTSTGIALQFDKVENAPSNVSSSTTVKYYYTSETAITLPFNTTTISNGEFVNPSWYYMTINGYPAYAYDGKMRVDGSKGSLYYDRWCFVGDAATGVKIYSETTGATMPVRIANYANNDNVEISTTTTNSLWNVVGSTLSNLTFTQKSGESTFALNQLGGEGGSGWNWIIGLWSSGSTIVLTEASDANAADKIGAAIVAITENTAYQKEGELGYPPISEYNALNSKIIAASNSQTADNYKAMKDQWQYYLLQSPVVFPTNGKFYRIKGATSQRYLTCEAAASKNDRLGASTTADVNTIFYWTGGKLLGYKNGYYTSNTCEPGTINTTGQEYTLNVPGELGIFSIKGGGYLYSHTNADKMYFDRNGNNYVDACRMIVEEVTSLPVTISAAGWATFSAPVALTIPDGVTAYTATESNETLTLTALEDVIPANTGVLLKGEAATYNFPITTASDFAGTNIFSNTTAAISVTANTNYVLANKNNSLGFYKLNDTTMPGFKAYIPANVLSTSSVSFIGFADDDVTAVNSAISDQILNGQYYDLQGRKVAAPQKGQLYIVNGKKVLY